MLVGACRATICAGVPTDSFDVGGPKFGRRRLKPNPIDDRIYMNLFTALLLHNYYGIYQ